MKRRFKHYRVIVNGGQEFWIRALHVAAAVHRALKQYKSPLGKRGESWIVRVTKHKTAGELMSNLKNMRNKLVTVKVIVKLTPMEIAALRNANMTAPTPELREVLRGVISKLLVAADK